METLAAPKGEGEMPGPCLQMQDFFIPQVLGSKPKPDKVFTLIDIVLVGRISAIS